MNVREERANQLLQAALEVVLKYGYRKTTLDDIATAAGVSRATVYNYFDNKDELVRAIVEQEVDRLREAVMGADDPSRPAAERLKAFAHARYGRLRPIKELYGAVLDQAGEIMPLAGQVFQEFEDEQRRFLAALLREGIASGQFRCPDPDLLAAALLVALRGLSDAFIFHGQDSVEQGAHCLMTTLLEGLLVREVQP